MLTSVVAQGDKVVGNPLVTWLDLYDKFGTNIGQYHFVFDGAGINVIAWISEFLTSAIGLILINTLGALILGLVNFVTNPDLLLGWIADIYGAIISGLHSVISPLWIAGIAATFVILRLILPSGGLAGNFGSTEVGKALKDSPLGRGWGWTKGQAKYSGEGDIRDFLETLGHAAVVFVIIIFLTINPVEMIVKIVAFVSGLGEVVTSTGGDNPVQAGGYAQDILMTLYMLINFGGLPVNNECYQVWSYDMANGTEDFFRCTGSVMEKADLGHLVTVIFGVLVITAMAYFMWTYFSRTIVFLAYALWDLGVLPYVLAFQMFKPEFKDNNRVVYDTALAKVTQAVVYVAYYVLGVFLLTSGPAIVLRSVGSIGLPVILNLIIVSAVFWGAAKLAPYILNPDLKNGRPNNLGGVKNKFVTYKLDGDGNRVIDWKQTSLRVKEEFKAGEVYTGFKGVKDTIKTKIGMTVTEVDKDKLQEELKAAIDALPPDTPPRIKDYVEGAYKNYRKSMSTLEAMDRVDYIRYKAGNLTEEEYENRKKERALQRQALRSVRDHMNKTQRMEPMILIPEHLRHLERFANRTQATKSEIDQAEKERVFENFKAVTGVEPSSIQKFYTVSDEVDRQQDKVEQLELRLKEAADRNDYALQKKYATELEGEKKELAELKKLAAAKSDFESTKFAEGLVLARNTDKEGKFTKFTFEHHDLKEEAKAASQKKEKKKIVEDFVKKTGYSASDYNTYMDVDNQLQIAENKLDGIQDEKRELRHRLEGREISPQAYKAAHKEIESKEAGLKKRVTFLQEMADQRDYLEGRNTETVVHPLAHHPSGDYPPTVVLSKVNGITDFDGDQQLIATAYLHSKVDAAVQEINSSVSPALSIIQSIQEVVGGQNSTSSNINEALGEIGEAVKGITVITQNYGDTTLVPEVQTAWVAAKNAVSVLEDVESTEDVEGKEAMLSTARRGVSDAFRELSSVSRNAGKSAARGVIESVFKDETQKLEEAARADNRVLSFSPIKIDPENPATWNMDALTKSVADAMEDIRRSNAAKVSPPSGGDLLVTGLNPSDVVTKSDLFEFLDRMSRGDINSSAVVHTLDTKYPYAVQEVLDIIASADLGHKFAEDISRGISEAVESLPGDVPLSMSLTDGTLRVFVPAGMYDVGSFVTQVGDEVQSADREGNVLPSSAHGDLTSPSEEFNGGALLDTAWRESRELHSLKGALVTADANGTSTFATSTDSTSFGVKFEGDTRSLDTSPDGRHLVFSHALPVT